MKYSKRLLSLWLCLLFLFGTSSCDTEHSSPETSEEYRRSTFLVKDDFHPNMLTGYIQMLTAYCAMTGASPIGMPYRFYNDSSLNPAFDFDAFTKKYYNRPEDTNFPAVFASESDMLGIQKIIARYLEEKPYRNYESPLPL